ncbi:hypothetical protein EOI86_00280 [Hwanghaeella grinnelliae]|uniref:Tripartite tricarboxylate transporter TctB family protein n=1 Tax=Hwanghaeella grinnelliae TaxID=2500179 RepID=A0A3S2Z9Y9_9PROT|nr:hypothetical protein [Hwanghaeella grinnelliae]RVU37779.1 hypothetical protein EOI86_00280 [Hwanghaeella grinnelliae]
MLNILNRLQGAVVALGGVVLYFFVIPHHTEVVDYGWVRPQTLPAICAVALVLFGTIDALFLTGGVSLPSSEAARAALFVVLTGGALFAMDRLGYLAGAFALALLVMLTVGERRPGWIALGALAAPAVVWSIAVPLLGRTLP